MSMRLDHGQLRMETSYAVCAASHSHLTICAYIRMVLACLFFYHSHTSAYTLYIYIHLHDLLDSRCRVYAQYLCIYAYCTDTDTHTHIYIYIYLCVCAGDRAGEYRIHMNCGLLYNMIKTQSFLAGSQGNGIILSA